MGTYIILFYRELLLIDKEPTQLLLSQSLLKHEA